MTEKTWVVIHVAAAPWAPAPHAAVPSFFSLWTEGQQTPHSCGSWGTLTHSNKAHGVTQGQLHHSNRIVSSKKILLNSGICACTTSTEECAGVFFFSFIYTRKAPRRCDMIPEVSRMEEWWKPLLTHNRVIWKRCQWKTEGEQANGSITLWC